MGAHRRPARAGRRRRAEIRAAVAAIVVVVAGMLLGGVGAAAPLLDDTATGALLSEVGDDPDGFVRDQGVPVPDVPPCLPTARACVDLDARVAWLVDMGRPVRGPVPIMSGDVESPTPRGAFTVQWKAAEYTSREFLVQMPWSVFFADGGIAFHQGDPTTFSAGCVKLGPDDAQAFFTFLQVGDAVQIL
jgi:L,D-transpeptidase catalytic domain